MYRALLELENVSFIKRLNFCELWDITAQHGPRLLLADTQVCLGPSLVQSQCRSDRLSSMCLHVPD